MTNQEIKDTGLLIKNEQHIGGNTALRVGGVIEGIGYALDNKDAANGYYQATINGGSISVNAPNFVLGNGGNLRIKMPAAGTTASTLAIGNANAVQLWYNGAAVSSDNTWEAGEIISVFYDGTRFMASNSQGGSGKAEKIKYDNSQSGLASDDVQGAIDEVTSLIPREIHSTWVQGGIAAIDGSDTDTTVRIRSTYIAVNCGDKIHVNPKTHYVGIYLYNTDKTSALGDYAYLLSDGGVEYEYVCPQKGWVRFLEAKTYTAPNQYILPSEQIADIMIIPDSVYVLKSEMKEKADRDEIASEVNLNEIAQGVGYPELSSGKWRTNIIGGTNRYHKVLERKSGMDFIKIDSDTSKTARYCFLTAYPNALASKTNDNVYTVDFCSGHSTVYSIPQDSSSGWVEIPSDCKYIVLIELNNAVNYLPKSVYVVKDVADNIDGYELPFFCFWQGSLATADGSDTTTTARIKTGFFPVKQGDRIHIDYNNQHVSIREFDSSKTQIYNTGWYAEQEYVCQGDGYVRFIVANKAASIADLTPSALTASITFPISIDNRITNADWRSKGGFVVGSWNIGHFSHGAQTDSTITASTYETMKAAYKKAVEYMNADLVSLSEYSPIFYGSETARTALFDDMSWGHVGVQRQYACQAVYADHKIEGVSDIDITSVTTTHYYTVITFEHFGKTIKFLSVHIQANADIPAQFTELINAFANDEYVIITGDFNVTNMADLSAFTNAGYTIANGGAWGNIETFTRTKTSDGYCLDNIVAKGFYMTDVKTFPFELSDHYPFVCRLMLKQN